MRPHRWLTLVTIALLVLVTAPALADDGELFRHNVSKTPELETEHAALTMLKLYVPAQTSDGTLLAGIEYTNADGALVDTRTLAKPLVAVYQDGHVEAVEGTGFTGHGHRDAYAAVSLDDGATWKRTNLSQSGDLSSFTIQDGKVKVPYPGDVVTMFTTSAGDAVLVAWASRYCQGGSPTYAASDTERAALATHLGLGTACTDGDPVATPCLYLEDLFGVAGSQGSSDFADEGYPQVGEVPYSCLWTARGTLVTDAETGLSEILWRKAERLTSGSRDVNRIEVAGVAGAGFVVTWQEDPDGLRPGEGEGPGEGWSGAIAHHQTDVWYSFIAWDEFALVDNDTLYGDPVTLDLYTGDGIPPVGVPMSMPLRLTDNAMCTMPDAAGNSDDPYCYADLDASGTADVCAGSMPYEIVTPVGTQQIDMCITEDGRLMRGNIASTRARVNLQGYDSDGDGDADSAWVVLAYEESKGLGEEEVDAGTVDPSDPAEYTKVDMGKNIWYHSFDMFAPELVSQGLMLNPPAQYPDDFVALGSLVPDTGFGYNFMRIEPDPIYEVEGSPLDSTLYQSEIARRFSLISQAADEVGPSGTVAFATWKQGIIRQGGPADVMARRFVLPDGFDPAVDNPFASTNMACDQWAFTDGSNPRYVKGLCVAPAITLSATTIVLGDCGDELACQEAFPWNDYFDDLAGGTEIASITEWRWCDAAAGLEGCTGDDDIDDTSWENPYDVAKGHRGFIDGDFLMVLYAWSPNWRANTVGHDNYNLYVRRSFDGGQTWTTTPASFTHTDGVTYGGGGTTTCEWMGPAGSFTEYPVCTAYGAGAFEQARNVSQLVGTKVTILDPRYTPTEALPPEQQVYDDDIRDPSRYFMIYETGDNTTVAEGEAEPLDLYYGRAVEFGDHYLVWQDEANDACLPAADPDISFDLSGFCNEFDWIEGSRRSLSGEASVTANPAGTFLYAVWNQEDLDRRGNLIGSDAWFRRVMFLDDYVPGVDDGTGPGGGGGGQKK